MPMTVAEVGDTKAHGAVMATSPASIPLQAMVMSGLPNTKYHNSMAAAEPATAARFVFTATTEMRRSVAPRVEPGLKPIHPNNKMNVQSRRKRCCARGKRGFSHQDHIYPTAGQNYGKGHGAEAADGVDNGRAGKVDIAMTEIQRGTDLRQPASAPRPATGNRIENRSDEEFTEQERPERDPLADGADNDVAGSLHEHNFEERETVAATVIPGPVRKTLASDKTPLAAAHQEMVERRVPPRLVGAALMATASNWNAYPTGSKRERQTRKPRN